MSTDAPEPSSSSNPVRKRRNLGGEKRGAKPKGRVGWTVRTTPAVKRALEKDARRLGFGTVGQLLSQPYE